MLVNPLTGWHTAGTLLHKAWLCPSQHPHPLVTFVTSSFHVNSHICGEQAGVTWCLFSFVLGHRQSHFRNLLILKMGQLRLWSPNLGCLLHCTPPAPPPRNRVRKEWPLVGFGYLICSAWCLPLACAEWALLDGVNRQHFWGLFGEFISMIPMWHFFFFPLF